MDTNCPTNFFNDENCLVKWEIPRKVIEKEEQTRLDDEETEEKETPLETLLNGAFPPREWDENGIKWSQKVSLEPAKRIDVIKLSQRLDNMMAEQNAKDTGICDIRRRLHMEMLDEVTRQVLIHDESLGLLLLKVRDDLNMTIMCYRALYENSVQYGLKKASEAEQGRREIEEIIQDLQDEKAYLEEEKKNALKSVDEKERRAVAEKDLMEALHQQKIEHYEKTNHALQELLDTVIISKM